MTRGLCVAALACAGCPGPAAQGTSPEPTPVATLDAAPDAPAASEDEKLAMVGHAMTQLAPAANQCWAAGAVDDYLLKGTVALQIAPHGEGARVTVAHDTTDDRVLTACLVAVAGAYRWPAALAGEVYELPFAFEAPDGQFTIDRRLVPVNAQAGVGIAVLLDEKNSNNPAASMLEVTVAAGARVALAEAERHEVWYVVAGGGVLDRLDPRWIDPLGPGDLVDVRPGTRRGITAGDRGLTAVVVLVPGGIEGVARGGALPRKIGSGAAPGKSPAQPEPRVVRRDQAAAWKADQRVVEMYLDSAAKGAAKDVAAEVLVLDAGAAVPEHVHAGETELLYVLAGAADMVIDGVALPVTEHTVVQIPKGVKHRATVTAPLRALQLYTPGGPEQRFKP